MVVGSDCASVGLLANKRRIRGIAATHGGASLCWVVQARRSGIWSEKHATGSPRPRRRRHWAAAHRAEMTLSLRITVAGLIALALGELLGVTQVYWAVLTAVIVMQASVG